MSLPLPSNIIPNHIMRLQIKAGQLIDSNRLLHGLVDNPKNGYDVLILRLRDKLGYNSDVVQRSLGVGEPHVAF